MKKTVKKSTEVKYGKCLICERPLERKDLFPNGAVDCINGAVIGEYIEIKGHHKCIHNVDEFVVLPNRVRIMSEKSGMDVTM